MLADLSAPVDEAAFVTVLLERAAMLFGADRTSFAFVSPATGGTGQAWPQQMPTALAEVFRLRFGEHPTVRSLRAGDDTSFRLREHYSLYDLRRLPMYHDFIRPLGDRDQLAMTLADGGAGFAAVGISRVDGQFTVDDQRLLGRLAGPVRHLYGSARRHRIRSTVLTAREQQVLLLVSDGHTDYAIGRRLGVSRRTVEKHLEAVRAKLGVTSRAAAVAHWLGTMTPDRPVA
jgi:DNA-binding CsgD family transcriptional regulator